MDRSKIIALIVAVIIIASVLIVYNVHYNKNKGKNGITVYADNGVFHFSSKVNKIVSLSPAFSAT